MSLSLEGRVAAILGGGGGIGSAISREFSRLGARVIVIDNGVGVEGEPLGEPSALETVRLIEEDGGLAVASTASITDDDALRSLFDDIVVDHGSLDIVVHAAGILRFSSLADSTEEDWRSVLGVHWEGYLNVLTHALPIMATAGYGRIVALTSGSGLARTSPGNPAYGVAKRAMAALTWELGRTLPTEIRVNALSPIAATRMVQAAILASGGGAREVSPRAVDLSAMPQPEDMARAAAFLVRDDAKWSQGRVFFSTGSEHTIIAQPRLVECVRSEGVRDFASALATLVPEVLVPAERAQRTGGGSNARFGEVFSTVAAAEPLASAQANCLIVSDDDEISLGLVNALSDWGGAFHQLEAPWPSTPDRFDGAYHVLRDLVAKTGRVDGVVVVGSFDSSTREPGVSSWQHVVRSQSHVLNQLTFHASWLRAAARMANQTSSPLRLIHLTPALTSSGRTTSQAVAQMTRNANDIASLPLNAYSISVESKASGDVASISALAARLLFADDTLALRGAELVAGRGWIGIRSHPTPGVTASTGRGEIPMLVDEVFCEWASSDI